MCKHKKNLHPLYPPPPQKRNKDIDNKQSKENLQKGKHIHIYRENESSFNAQREKKTLRSGVASTKNLLVEARI